MLANITINEHSSIRIGGDKVLYFDPYRIADDSHDADIVLITHAHYDHFSPEDILKIKQENTIFVMPRSMQGEEEKIGVSSEQVIWLQPNDEIELLGYGVCAIPSYNTNKPMHPKENGWLGYVVDMNGTKLYVAGDTDITEEAKQVSCDIALLPIGGTYTMNAKEAAYLANIINPAIVIPTHYGTLVGKFQDADEFQPLVKNTIKVCLKL